MRPRSVRRAGPPADEIRRAAAAIRRGEIVAFPTETVYGLGADALNPAAVTKIFAAKGRPADNPLIVHVSDRAMLEHVVARVPPAAARLMRRFWPGPLTIVFPRSQAVPDAVTAGLQTVAVRMPDHPVALRFIAESGCPVAAPSANRSGRPSPTTAAHVRQDFPHVRLIDGGPARYGLESTVVSVDGAPRVLRAGAVTLEELREVLPRILQARHRPGEPPPSPGMKYRHYAPKLPLVLFGPRSIVALQSRARRKGVVVLCRTAFTPLFRNAVSLGTSEADVARNLFDALRRDYPGAREILVLGVPRRGLGRAIMDRLEKAASEVV